MKIKNRKQILETIIEALDDVISKREKQRKRDAVKIAQQRKRAMMKGLDSLAKGIVEVDELKELVAGELNSIVNELEEDRVRNPEEFRRKCKTLGLRSMNDFLRIQNLFKRSSDGDLLDAPKKQKEHIQKVDELNPCGNRHRDAKTGHFASKEDKGVDSTYFCDGKPRKQRGGGVVNEPDNCGRSSRMNSPSKDVPCYSKNPKLKKKGKR